MCDCIVLISNSFFMEWKIKYPYYLTVLSVFTWRKGLSGPCGSLRLWKLQKVTLGHNQILFMFMYKNHDFHNRWLPKNTFKENKRKCIIRITTWVSEGWKRSTETRVSNRCMCQTIDLVRGASLPSQLHHYSTKSQTFNAERHPREQIHPL